MPLEVLSRFVGAEAGAVREAKAGLDERRSKGVHGIASKSEKFILEFDRFLSAYSGIVNIVALADAQYGGVASATLTVLFTTVKMKAKDEAAIISAMGHISDRLPDFKIYEKIYPDPELGGMLADAYRDVILLAREGTLYFQGSTFRRQFRNLGKPLEFESMEEGMRDNFSRIRLKCETLLAQRVDMLVAELEEMQKRNDRGFVAGLRDALMLGDYRLDEAKKELIVYRGVLETKFDRDRHRQKLMLTDFLADAKYQCWTAGGSVVLVLSGANDSGIASTSESWLSPMAVDLTQDLLDRQRNVAFEMCDETSTVEEVLARLIYQLLERNPKVVRKADDWHDIETHISNHKSDRQASLMAALLRVINLQEGPVFIILNRPELNRGEDAGEYLRTMQQLARDTTGELKVLVVQRSELWDFEENRYSVVPRGAGQKHVQAIRLDQRRLN
ncbi:hypothetical protein K458DRAFT_401613 [Lentithecium fluviatile CBS 122367]|uniref:Uncharacterized protein n=1 Tax=Lentithecium fluviatile CBS 122367 TaxID=1168545 RepID=A0A6G1JDE1_9PLEO|nr:hypothetical protein K458DRAFT_401613 [Lentithecium fluviatile CBS 122367]